MGEIWQDFGNTVPLLAVLFVSFWGHSAGSNLLAEVSRAREKLVKLEKRLAQFPLDEYAD